MASAADWHAPGAGELRGSQREADRLLRAGVHRFGRPDRGTAAVDAVLLHPVAGLVILLAILFVMFQAVFAWARPLMDAIAGRLRLARRAGRGRRPADLLKSFLKDGLIAGVGSVMVFLPQIVILFFFILVLEDLGYMARAAFLMDRIMGGAGLHGRAFIPLLSCFACAIPGIMATRVIDDRRDRLTTILVAPLMTCSARIPVYTLIICAFIPDREVWGFIGLQGLVMFGLYASGIAGALAVSFVIKRMFWRRRAGRALHARAARLQDPAAPRASPSACGRAPDLPQARRHHHPVDDDPDLGCWPRFPQPPEGATDPAINYSLAAMIGRAMEPLTQPLGFNWQINVALIPGMAAREVAVGALGTIYAIDGGEGAADKIGQAWPANGASPRRWRCSPGTSSRRNAPRPSPSSAARPAAGNGWRSPSSTCWRWPMPRRWPPTRSPARWARADRSTAQPAIASQCLSIGDGTRLRCPWLASRSAVRSATGCCNFISGPA